jgi:hypothetical protein
MTLLLLGVLAGCAQQPHPLPAGARADLAPDWIDAQGYRWPPQDGFAEVVSYMVLPPGVLLDRFGSENGRFFSPKGAAFKARALPTVCAELPYSTYRVTTPMLVRVGSAAAWFGHPGGATQMMTDATAAQLVADGVLTRLPPEKAVCL